MSKPVSYYEQKNMDYTTKLREVLAELPAFCRDFLRRTGSSGFRRK